MAITEGKPIDKIKCQITWKWYRHTRVGTHAFPSYGLEVAYSGQKAASSS